MTLKLSSLKYYSILSFLLLSLGLVAQPNNQAVVTIIGDPVGNNEQSNFNPYQQQLNNPPPNQEFIQSNVLIEPSLENGFHMRFEVGSTASENSFSSKPSLPASGGSASVKAKKRQPTMSERSFNVKKRLKSWLPKRKKRYRPNLCGRF
jgi:hypothetical protein